MPSIDSQHTGKSEPKRRYHGDLWGGMLAHYLNEEPNAEDVSILREILSLCSQLEFLAKRANLTSHEWLTRGVDPPEQDELIEIERLEKRLEVLLSDFTAVPRIRLSGDAKEGQPPALFAYWALSPGSRFAALDAQRPWPLHDVLTSAIADGSLSKVCVCNCGKYYFQKFGHQKFCSSECRIRENQQSENAREYRRRKQREYYHLEKKRNQKNLEQTKALVTKPKKRG